MIFERYEKELIEDIKIKLINDVTAKMVITGLHYVVRPPQLARG